MRVFGWPETWRVVPEGHPEGGWRFRIVLAPGSPGREAPPFLERTEWRSEDLPGGLAEVKDEITIGIGKTIFPFFVSNSSTIIREGDRSTSRCKRYLPVIT